jgi:hypothetical protein
MAIPYILVNLDKERKLRFGMGAVLEFQQLAGLNLLEAANNISPEVAVKMAWVMFKQEDKELTLEKTAELIDERYDGNMFDFISQIQEALTIAFEDRKAKKSKNAEKPIPSPSNKNTKPESAISE